jgi:CheY-like chemotaxis protein
LLVDDEELVRVSTADMLTDLGWIVVEADSAEAALALMTSPDKPDLLITDHLMPGMSGAQLAHQVRSSKPALPILLMSGYAESDGISRDFARLNKPFRKDELAASISTLIDSSHR